MSSGVITKEEQLKYFEIFSALNPRNGYLTGAQAKPVLENSHLSAKELAAIWDLADIDGGMTQISVNKQTAALTLRSFVLSCD